MQEVKRLTRRKGEEKKGKKGGGGAEGGEGSGLIRRLYIYPN